MRQVEIIFIFFCLFSFSCLADNVSGTLPVMYINTEGGKSIKDKVNYIEGTYYVDAMGVDWCSSLGSADVPLHLQIRGRGNYTWASFDKKPYRIKLAEKQPLLGMNKSRHFALLAHADDDVAFLRNTVGFEVSRRIGIPFTPEQRPVEVVLNGDYIGLYFLTETVRVATKRVNILEQRDGQEHEDSVTGGWLLEIDNTTQAEQQIRFSTEGTDLWRLKITYHSPDSLSAIQTAYLIDQIESIKRAIYFHDGDSTLLEKIIDLNSLARFYIVHELIDQLEGFVGSCYLYKDINEEKWKFGPVWDLGNAFNSYHDKHQFIYQNSPYPISIMNTVCNFDSFQKEVLKVWNEFYPDGLEGIDNFINSFLKQIEKAAVSNARRWPEYGNSNVWESAKLVFTRFQEKAEWLDSQWHREDIQGIADVSSSNVHLSVPRYFNMQGMRINAQHPVNGLLIVSNGRKYFIKK